MKLVYCPSCDDVFMRSRIERSRCPECGGDLKKVNPGISWQHVTAWIVLLAGAATILLLGYQSIVPNDILVRILLFVVFAIVAYGFSAWGVEDQKKTALEMARKREKNENRVGSSST